MGRDSKLSGAEWRILSVLIANTKNPGDTIEACIPAIARMTGLHKQTVKEARVRLIERGYLIPVGNGEGGVLHVRLADYSCEGGSQSTTGSQSATGSQTTTKVVVNRLPPSPKIHINKKQETSVPPHGEVKKKTKKTSKPKQPEEPQPTPEQIESAQKIDREYRTLIRTKNNRGESIEKSVSRIAQILISGETEERLLNVVKLAAVDMAERENRFRKGIKAFFSADGGLWASYLPERYIGDDCPEDDEDLNDPRAIAIALECIEEEKAEMQQQQEDAF